MTVIAAVVLAAGCGGGDGGDDLVGPEIQPPPTGGVPVTSTTVAPEVDQVAESTTTTEPLRDVAEFDLAATSTTILCPGGASTVPLSGETSDAVVAEVETDLSYDLGQDGVTERVVLVSCRIADHGGDDEAAPSQRSVVALAASADGLVQLGDPIPGRALHEVDESLVAERRSTVDGSRRTTFTPLTIDEGRLAEGGIGLPFSVEDPALPMGVGGLEIGASFALLANNVGDTVTVHDVGSGEECTVVRVDGVPDDIRGLGGDGSLASVEVGNPDVRTDAGLGVGSSADEVRAVHGDHLERAQDPDVPERQFLVASPPDTGGLTVVFEMDGDNVVGFRIGEPGWTSALDGCR